MRRQSFFHPYRPLEREFHISRDAREKYNVEDAIVSIRGTVMVADPAVAHRLAAAMNAERDARRYPESAVRAGDLVAAALLDEILHLVLQVYRERVDPQVLDRAERTLRDQVGDEGLRKVLERFVDRFPTVAAARGEITPEAYLAGETEGVPNRHVALEELLMLDLANRNPAMERFADLFDDAPLADATEYRHAVKAMREHLGRRPGLVAGAGTDADDDAAAQAETRVDAGAGDSLLDLLEAPMRASPTSLDGQLGYVRERWGSLLGTRFQALLQRIVRSLDVLEEERRPRGFGGAGPSIVPDASSLRGRGREEYEAFSTDESWMPRLVMVAKSTYVWLDQLSKRYEQDITRLDQIPDEVLDEMAERGLTGLWLIGLWERSEASRRIKHLRGQKDAVASAYALFDYQIAADLGGDAAYVNLRDRAWRRGIRLASDMVPNHVGIDGKWVMEHPDWFVQVDESPYPGYTFDGPDLSSHPNAAVHLEDHYFDSTDAAVVFKRVDRGTGRERFIYHGNDGTTMPWNDTAQLDYLNPEVREAVIQTILHVARKFPVIRFDAAMTLAKQHIQRLWYPEPGHGGAIPSRSQYGSLSDEEFERRIPKEFWREVVDRVAEEVPGTLLLAEAFWMMEGYFVRTLGMHRVYNSAFMNMLKREENDKYRQLIKNTLEFDPEILKRFVNFMNNPDEETAVAQFGRDDKYFGTTVVMSTMPGLPMYGHGQIEGYTEKYGMEYRRARLDEHPDEDLIARHRREVFPLLHRREQFAHVENFRLYDVRSEQGVAEDVYAYSNRHRGQASLVFYNNRFESTAGWIQESAPFQVKDGSGGSMRTQRLADALALEGGDDRFLILRDQIGANELLRKSDDVREKGFFVELGAFKYQVYVDLREVVDVDGTYGELYRSLAGAAIPSVEDARLDLQLADVHDAFLRLVRAANGAAGRAEASAAGGSGRNAPETRGEPSPEADGRAAHAPETEAEGANGGASDAPPGSETPGSAAAVPREAEHAAEEAFEAFLAAAGEHTAVTVRPGAARRLATGVERLSAESAHHVTDIDAELPDGLLAAVVAVEPLAEPASVIRELRLDRALARELQSSTGMSGDEAWLRSRLFAALAEVLTPLSVGTLHADRILSTFAAADAGRDAIAVNVHEGIAWFHRERYREAVAALVAVAAWARPGESVAVERFAAGLLAAEEASGYRYERLTTSPASKAADLDADSLGEAAPLEAGEKG